MTKKVILVIMDGWGLAKPDKFNAIDNAKKPNYEFLIKEYPNTKLTTHGLAVGLPEDQFGTSEVNHLTIGGGRVIFQDLPKINRAIENGDFFTNNAILKTIDHAENNKSKLHLIGILSDGGVHSHIKHLFSILDLLARRDFKQKIYLHIFTDGRDVAPKSAEKYFKQLEEKISELKNINVHIATIQGRSYLDRDRDWNRTEKGFELIRKGKGTKMNSWKEVILDGYKTISTDEMFSQYLINKDGLLEENDGVIIYHFRTDRIYQLIKRLIEENLNNLSITSFVQPSEDFDLLNIAFPREKVLNTLSEIISEGGFTQMHVTESEKFPHLTFFFNGEKEKEMVREDWKMFDSNRFVKPQYNFEPSMRNFEITKEIISAIETDKYDFIVSNLSSPDMVGHTGSYHAALISAESIDHCLGKLYDAIKDKLDDYILLITADHGNSEIMWDYENEQPHTQHTTSPVPFIVVTNEKIKLTDSKSLADIAPTILKIMGLENPGEMTGESLIK